MSDTPYHFHIANDPIFMENSYTVYRGSGGPCWIIDPGLPPQGEEIIRLVRDNDLKPRAVVLTHAHGDHIAGVDEVRQTLGPMPLYLAEPEWHMLSSPAANLSVGIGMDLTVDPTDLHDLSPGDCLELDGGSWKILDVAGHSPGGRALYCEEEQVVIVGDALFAGSIGRYDFPHSDGDRLIGNILTHLMALPDETRVLSGHGPETTIGHERRTNQYVLNGL